MTTEELLEQILRILLPTAMERRRINLVSKVAVQGLPELQCLCRTQYHCEKHCTAGDHV